MKGKKKVLKRVGFELVKAFSFSYPHRRVNRTPIIKFILVMLPGSALNVKVVDGKFIYDL